MTDILELLKQLAEYDGIIGALFGAVVGGHGDTEFKCPGCGVWMRVFPA